jgi:aminoglycoside phosphotransferase (APT) family kinase protein
MSLPDINDIETLWGLHNVQFAGPLLDAGAAYGSQGVTLLRSREGEFVLKEMLRVETTAVGTRAEVEQRLALLAFLNRAGYPYAPALRVLADGHLCAVTNGRAAYLYRYVTGAVPERTPANYARLGEALVALHRLPGFELPVRWTMDDIVTHIVRDRAPQLPVAMRDDYIRLAERLRGLDALPRCLIHGDISLDNTILTPDGPLVIVDWDGGGVGVRLLDAAKPLFEFVSADLAFLDANADAFYRAYYVHTWFSDSELRRFVDAALLLPLNYILYGDTGAKWDRIRWLDGHREELGRWITELNAEERDDH